METADFGLIGLAVMGQNLVLNMDDHGFRVAVFNRTPGMDEFRAGKPGPKVVGRPAPSWWGPGPPRRVMLLVKAGAAVDAFIGQLVPTWTRGTSSSTAATPSTDTVRRTAELESKGLLFVGTGVSGGEEGARHGPSIMPGGGRRPGPTWPIFQAIAAHAGRHPCCDWVGENGAGHYVKMVHNGIEYGDMQLIAEAYHLLRRAAAWVAPSWPPPSPSGTEGPWTPT